MFKIQSRRVDEQKVISVERRTLADELSKVIAAAGETLHGGAAERGIEMSGPAMVIYHGQVTMDADGPVEVCQPVTGDVQPFADVRVRLEPAHEEAYTTLTKAQVAFPEILGVYEALEKWLDDNGKRMSGSPREIMFVEWSQIGDDDPAADVAWPFSG